MSENKLRVELKPGIESGRVHTTGFDLVLMPGETAEVTEEQYQRLVLGTGLFEVAEGDRGSKIEDRRSRIEDRGSKIEDSKNNSLPSSIL